MGRENIIAMFTIAIDSAKKKKTLTIEDNKVFL